VQSEDDDVLEVRHVESRHIEVGDPTVHEAPTGKNAICGAHCD
jgi:hypothetical protein